MDLKDRMAEVERRILEACNRSGRSREEVNLVAVTKYVSLDTTREVLNHGLQHIGENRWQDAREKWHALGAQGLGTWHFIGHLQSNKVKDVIGKFTYIHSIDRLSLAKELQKRADAADLTVKGFIQLNISGEASKYGLEPDKLLEFARTIRAMDRIQIIGLMTMAPYETEPEKTRSVFRGLREWRDRLNEEGIFPQPVRELSMGMSNDFEVAIEEGATWVRLGSVLVGRNV